MTRHAMILLVCALLSTGFAAGCGAAQEDTTTSDDVSSAASRTTSRRAPARAIREVNDAIDTLTDLVVSNEEAELDRLLGRDAAPRLGAALRTVRASLETNDYRVSRAVLEVDRFTSIYEEVVRTHDRNAPKYCFDRTFADRAGDAVDAIGGNVVRIGDDLRVDVHLPRPVSLSRICSDEIDGR